MVIEVLRGRKAVIAALSALETRGVATFTCGVVVAEILAGLRLWTLNRRHYPIRDVRFVDA